MAQTTIVNAGRVDIYTGVGYVYTVAAVSKPMKLITLRIHEEEKARLEQLADRGNVTLSRALREGAALYLSELQGKAHRARGGEATFHGIRRDTSGRVLNEPSAATPTERARLASLRSHLHDHGLQVIRESWDAGATSPLILAALGQWLSLVGHVYVSNSGEVGWDWFLRDYCGYSSSNESAAVRRAIRAALINEVDVDISLLLDTLDAGFRRFLRDAEQQEPVRRAVLPTWHVLERSVED
jgi:hypothetical protein